MIKKDSIIKKIASYSALASCALIAGEANGQIVYHKLTPHDTLHPFVLNKNTYFLDLNGDGISDFETYAQSDVKFTMSQSGFFFMGNLTDESKGDEIYESNGNIGVLQSGQSIGNKANWKDNRFSLINFDATSSNLAGNSLGHWKNQTDKFVGLRIKNKTTGAFNYGWLRLSVQFFPGHFGAYEDKVYEILEDYAYEQTPNKPIIAGDAGICTPAVSLSANGHKTIAPGDSVALHVAGFKKGDVVTWFRNGAILKSDSVSSLIVTEHGLYSALVENKKGCGQLTDSIQIKAVMPGMTTTEMNARPLSEIYVYNKTLVGKILSKDLSESALSIYNELGQEVLKQNVNEDNFTINLESLSTGIYFVRLINNGTMMEKKIFVE